jgi:hypothetical protein
MNLKPGHLSLKYAEQFKDNLARLLLCRDCEIKSLFCDLFKRSTRYIILGANITGFVNPYD